MTVLIGVVCEARADFLIGTELADRVLREHVDWLGENPEYVEHVRQFVGATPGADFVRWDDVRHMARERGVRIQRGAYGEQPAAPDAKSADRAMLLIRLLCPDVAAVLLVRDDDRDTSRRAGLEQARAEHSETLRVVIGLAHPCREAWVLAGFEPGTTQETPLLDAECAKLGFDPRIASDRLRTRPPGNDRDPKRIVRNLMNDHWERQADCWRETSLDVLRDRGRTSGLTSYLDDVEQQLVPLIRGQHR